MSAVEAEAAPPEAQPPIRVQLDITRTAILKVLGTWAALWLLGATWHVILWLLLSLVFVATFNPLVRRLQRRIHRQWAITSVVLLTVLVAGSLLAVIIPVLLRQSRSVLANLPAYLNAAEGLSRRVGLKLDLHSTAPRWVSALGSHAWDISWSVASLVMAALTIFVLTIYLLIEGPQVATNILSLAPRKERLHLRRMFGEIGDQVGAYMRGQLVTSAIAGAFAFVLLSVLGIPDALALAALMMLADVIPLIGPLVGTIPAALVAASRSGPTGLIVLLAYLVYFQLEANLIVPRVYGSALKLSPFVVLVAFLVGTTLLGMLGAVLALPVAAAIPIIARYVAEWRERMDEAVPVTLP